MKRKNFIFLLIAVLSLLVSCCWNSKEKADSEIFTSIEPIEWSDDYVISLTNTSNTIQIWNTKTKQIIKDITFIKDNRYLNIVDIAFLEKNIWIIGYGLTYNLIRIDIETGELDYKEFSYNGYRSRPYRIQAISKEEDGIGTLWVKSYGNAKTGTLFACYNTNGSLRESFEINCDIESTPMSAVYKNGKYFLLGASLDEVKINEKNQEIFSLLNLTDKTATKIKNSVFFDESFFEKEYKGINITHFITNAKIYRDNKLCINIVNSAISEINRNIADKCYYTIKSYEPFEIEYSNIKFENANIVNFMENNNYEYVLLSPKNKDGYELQVLDKKTKNKIKFLEIINAFSVCLQGRSAFTNNVTWILLSNFHESENMSEIPEICKFDHETGKVFVYSQDGSERELEWCDVTE